MAARDIITVVLAQPYYFSIYISTFLSTYILYKQDKIKLLKSPTQIVDIVRYFLMSKLENYASKKYWPY